MRATFIRHGQSTGNAGIPCHDLATIELTEKGSGSGATGCGELDRSTVANRDFAVPSYPADSRPDDQAFPQRAG